MKANGGRQRAPLLFKHTKEMKELTVKKIDEKVKACEVPQLFDKAGIAETKIDTVNWKEYPYQPDVTFRIAYNSEAIMIHYKVKEKSVRAAAGKDNGPVWEDACVEFFSVPAGDGIYYNMECNCAGTLLIGAGKGRENRERAPQEALDAVDRWASLGRESFEEKIGECEWELALVIPFKAFFKHQITSMEGKSIRANFYKCGDKLNTPHFLSWNRIEVEKPDFHLPAFFGTLSFR